VVDRTGGPPTARASDLEPGQNRREGEDLARPRKLTRAAAGDYTDSIGPLGRASGKSLCRLLSLLVSAAAGWPCRCCVPFRGPAGLVPGYRTIVNPPDVHLDVQLGRLLLANPILVASGTFGYAREMAGLVDTARLGGILPKTITPHPRAGNPPPRTIETASGMLNSIGLDNDGIDAFIERQLPYLASLGTAIIVSIAGSNEGELIGMAARLDGLPGVAALELNVSCPNVSGGVDFGTDAGMCERLVAGVRGTCSLPVLAKLTPNVTDISQIARAAEAGGADAVSLINTCLGMAVDWRRRRPILGNVLGGLSGPAIKPIALGAVYRVARAVDAPVVGIGGIASIDDVMEFLVAGATAVQIGTANFYNPTVSIQILDALPAALAELGVRRVADVVGTIQSG
jgi:dihydroorotate dehydrogenase (NAD+) catalytic subunit